MAGLTFAVSAVTAAFRSTAKLHGHPTGKARLTGTHPSFASGEKLIRNNDGKFVDVAEESGLLDGAFGMSSSFGDFNRDGLMDLYVSNMFSAAGSRVTSQPGFKTDLETSTKSKFRYLARGNSLFRNAGNGQFEDVSVQQGVTMGRWSWGSLFTDFNNDGWDDLLVANGFITGESTTDL